MKNLKALIIGGLTSIHDNEDPFGRTVEQTIKDVVNDYDYPVCFGFPAGHQPDNRALVFGKTITLKCDEKESQLSYNSELMTSSLSWV